MPVPVRAWDRIDAGLRPRKRRFSYLAIAASVTTVAIVASTVFVMTRKDNVITSTQLAENRTAIDKTARPEKTTNEGRPAQEFNKKEAVASAEQPQEAAKQLHEPKTTSNLAGRTLNKERGGNTSEKKAEAQGAPIPQTADETDVPVSVDLQEMIASNDGEEVREESPAATAAERQTVKLYVSAEETKKYQLENFASDATAEEKRTSTLKKVLRKASGLKKNQDPIGDLRQLKNEMLALNFKNNRQGGQKK